MNFRYPVSATAPVTQTFAQHVLRANANGWSNYNGGIDWAIPTGSPVEAAQAGTVTVARADATGYGTHVRIQHGEGYLTIYGHGSKLLVKAGEKVEAGDVIMLSGNTGNSTGPHLHFELRHNGKAIDPQPLLRSDPEPQPKPKPAARPGDLVVVEAGWNLRAGPGTDTPDLGTTDLPIAVTVVDRQGAFVRFTFDCWVHEDAITE